MLALSALVLIASVAIGSAGSQRSTLLPYAPYRVSCPQGPLIRPASSLNKDEALYISGRKNLASKGLSAWLQKTLDLSSQATKNVPTIALAMSGGGPKAELLALGAMHGLDGRDSTTAVSGLLQGITYIAGLSGGSITVASVMGNDNARASIIKTKFFDPNAQNPFALSVANIGQIVADVGAKTLAGYPSTIIDVYGRGISYAYIGGPQQGGNAVTWSGILSQSSFVSHEAPLPLITMSNTFVEQGQCQPNTTGAVWEVSPFEFGSWDPSIDAFIPTALLGTRASNGAARIGGICTNGFDNVGLLAGMSSNFFPSDSPNCTSNAKENKTAIGGLNGLVVEALPALALPSLYGIIPNPFYKYETSSSVKSQASLYMVDGGFAGQGIPLMPFLQPERDVGVIIAIDSASFVGNLTDGTSIYHTYAQAKRYGLTKSPKVPTPEVYEAERLASRAQFFGCYDTNVVTMVYIPDTNMTEYSAANLFLTPAQIDDMYNGGLNMVTQTGAADWPVCLACAIAHKTLEEMPTKCESCLKKYCWVGH